MKTKETAVTRKFMLSLMLMFLLIFGAGSIVATAEINLNGKILGNPLGSGTEKTKEGGTLSWKWVSVIYDDQLVQDAGYWTLLIEGKGSTLNYITTAYCGEETNTPWYADSSMRNIAYAFVDEGITSLGNCFFAGMGSLMYVQLPESLKSIGEGAFAGCCNLRKVNIPKSVTSISSDAFSAATGYVTIYCESNSYAHQYAVEHNLDVYFTDKSECENNGHSSGTLATCTSAEVCRVCGVEIKSALGHSWGAWENTGAAYRTRQCSVCYEYERREDIEVTSVKIKGASKQLLEGKKLTLTAKVSPSNASNKKVKWKSSNTKYATVSSKGVVTAKAAGAGKKVKITATAKDGSGKKAAYTIHIKGAVKKIRLKASKKTVKAGKELTIKATVTVGKGGSSALKWSSSNTKYATVNSKGVVKTKKAGKGSYVTITAKAKDGSGKKATIKIKIK